METTRVKRGRGRPVEGEQRRTVKLNVWVEPQTAQAIDQARGPATLSDWLRDLIRRELGH